MIRRKLYIAMNIWLLMCVLKASAEWNVVFVKDSQQSAIPVSIVDSIKPTVSGCFDVFIKERTISVPSEWAVFSNTVSDTIVIDYRENDVSIFNPRLDLFSVTANKANVSITSKAGQHFVCRATGSSSNGRLVVDADTTMTLVLDNLSLTSRQANAICLTQKQKVVVILPTGTVSTLQNTTDNLPSDNTDTTNGCLYARGSLTFTGEGSLAVTGNYRHGIVSGKNITVEDGCLIINNVAKNGIHCDKFTLQSGEVRVTLANDASKGIKAKKEICIKGGQIEGEATGGVTINDGDTSYSTLLKSDGVMNISGGTIVLRHSGEGGRCISVDGNMTISTGTLILDCYGNGGKYTDANGVEDYYTPKCITVDDSLFINSGKILCLSTGLGGKGIVVDRYLAIGNEQIKEETPIIKVVTKGDCVINSIEEEKCFGYPKGIKVENQIDVFNGNIDVKTIGIGGEGIECKGVMRLRGAIIQCVTHEDGINVGQHLVIDGAHIYCCSTDNDGIDSNGKITIKDGIVVSISKHEQDESFDSDNGRFYIFGGIVFGIGLDWAKVREAEQPYYTTGVAEAINSPLPLHAFHYLTLMDGEKNMYSVHIPSDLENVFITFSMPCLSKDFVYKLVEADYIFSEQMSLFDGEFKIGGYCNNYTMLKIVQPNK